MSVSLSLKKRVKGLLSLVLAIATIVAVFPPIDAQASNYYYFLTGFDGSSLNVGYLVQSSHPYIALDYARSGSFEEYVSNLSGNQLYGSTSQFIDYLNVLNTSNNPTYATVLASVSLNGAGTSGSSVFTLNEDANIHIHDYAESGYYITINHDGNTIVGPTSYIGAYSDYYTDNLSSGDYRLDYSAISGNYYELSFDRIGDAGTYIVPATAGNPFIALMYQQIKDKANEIKLAAQGLNADGSVNATKTVYYNAPALNAEIIKALMNSNGVSLVVTYNFAGYEFTSTITSEKAKEMYNADITWYGPAYIAQYCGATWTGKTA